MKKTLAVLICVIMAAAMLSGCGMYASDSKSDGGNSYSMSSPGAAYREELGIPREPAPSTMAMYDTAESWTESKGYDNSNSGAGGAVEAEFASSTSGFSEKIIYSAYASIETVEFDETIARVTELMEMNGAFIESSSVGGKNYAQSYHGWQTYRTAHYSLRVPVRNLEQMVKSLGVLGNVTSEHSEGQNITSQFYDTESRLASYRTQEERLLSMLARTETVTDMIEIESRLSEVRYSIESMTTTLRNWQNQVDYSTLTLNINEVEKFTEYTPIQRTYWQQVSDGFSGTMKSIGNFFKDLFKWIVVNIPILVILAVIAIAAVIFGKRLARRRKSMPGVRHYNNRAQEWPDVSGQVYPGAFSQNQPAARDQNQPAARGQNQPAARDQSQPAARDQSQPVAHSQFQPGATGRTQPDAPAHNRPGAPGRTQPDASAQEAQRGVAPATEQSPTPDAADGQGGSDGRH